MLVFGLHKLLLLLTIYFSWSNGSEIFSVYLNSLNQFSETTQLLLRERLNEIKAKVVNTSESNPRDKRAILNPGRNKQDSLILEGVEIDSQITAPAVISAVTYIETSRDLYLVGAAKRNFDGSKTSVMNPVWIRDDATGKYKFFTNITTPSAIGVEGFVIDNEAYFIFAINTADKLLDFKKRSSKLYRINEKQEINLIQSFATTGVTKWKSFKSGDHSYLMQSSVVRWKRLNKLHQDYSKLIVPKTSSEVKVYKWTGVAFTKIANIVASQSTSVDAASLMGRTFLAVVNQTFGETNVESTVLIYEMSHGQIKLIQRVRGWSVSDVHFINGQTELYLAIAYNFRVQRKQIINRVDSTILRFNGLFFVKYQVIRTDCAMQWTTLKGPQNQHILHLQSSQSPDRLFQLIDGTWTELPVHLIQQNHKVVLGNAMIGQSSEVAVPTNGKVQLIQLNFVVQSADALRSRALHECREMHLKMRAFAARRRELEVSKRRMASLTQSQQLRGSKHFKSVDIKQLKLQKMVVKDTNVYRHVIGNRRKFVVEKLSLLPEHLENYLKKSARQVIRHAVVVNHIRVDKLTTRDIQFNVVNDRLFCQFLSTVVQLSALRVPDETRRLHFEHIVFRQDVSLRGTLNTVRIPAEVVFLDKPNNFTALKTFRHSISVRNDLKIGRTINRIRPEHILLTRDHQVIQSETRFHSDIYFVSVDLIGDVRVGGIPWSWFVNETVRLDSRAIIKGRKTMTNDVLVVGDLIPEGLLSGVDVATMFSQVIPINSNMRFSHEMQFDRVTFDKGLVIDGRLNGVSVPRDLVLLERGPWNLNLELNQALQLRKIDVSGTINGVQVDRYHIMTRSDDQVVFGEKSFGHVEFEHHLNVSGYVNGYNLSEITKKIKSEVVPLVNASFFRVWVENLHVAGQIPSDMHRLLYETVKTNRDYEFGGHVRFSEVTHFEQNLDLPPVVLRHLVPVRDAGKLVLNRKVFHHVVFVDDVTVRGTINDVDLNKLLQNVLMTSGNQTVKASKKFTDAIVVQRDSFVTDSINGFKLADLVKIDEDAEIKSKVTFQEVVTVREMGVFENTSIRHGLNGKEVRAWFDDTLTTTSDQVLTAPKKFVGVVNIGENRSGYNDLHVVGDIFLKDSNLDQFVDDVVLIDQTNIINSKTTFDVDVRIEALETRIVDNINIVDLFANALHLDERRCLEINSDVFVRHLRTKRIDNIDITEFFQNVVFTSDPKLPQKLHFRNVTTSQVKLRGLFQGVKFGEDAVTFDQFKKIDIHGPKTFHRVKMDKLRVEGTVNGIHLAQLSNNIVRRGSDQKINGVLTVDNLHVKNNISIEGLVSGHNLTRLMTQAWFIDEDVVMTGNVVLNTVLYNPTKRVDFQIRGLLNDVNLVYIYNNVMTIEGEQEIRAPLTFTNKVVLADVQIRGNIDLVKTSYVNQFNLPEWESKIMKTNKMAKVTAPITFVNSVSFNSIVITGKMNDIYLDDIMRLDKKKQQIENFKVLEKVVVRNLEIEGLFMGVDVKRWEEEAILMDERSPLVFTDQSRFKKLIFDHDVTLQSSLNEIDLSKIVTVNRLQQITGPKQFQNGIRAPRWRQSLHISGTVNMAPVPFQQLVQKLLTVPLQYPCEKEFVYFMNGCYLIYRGHSFCGAAAKRLYIFNEQEKQMLRNMRLVEAPLWVIPETNEPITVCHHRANLKITSETILSGTFTFTNQTSVLTTSHRSVYVTPLEREFNLFRSNYDLVINQMEIGAGKLQLIKDGVCAKLESYDALLQKAYRPLGPLHVLQMLHISSKRIISLDLKLTNGVMSFLVVDNGHIFLYAWQKNSEKFTLIQTISLPNPQNWLKIELNTHQDLIRREIVLFLAHSGECRDGLIQAIEIITLTLPQRWSAIQLKETASIPLQCTRSKNVQIAITRNQIYAIFGIKNEIHVQNINEPNALIRKPEPYDIYHVQLIDSHRLFAVASQYNGISLIAMYSFNEQMRRLEAKFSIQDLPEIRQISAPSQHQRHLPYHVTFLTKTQIQLVEFSPPSYISHSKQILNLECPTDLHWVTTRDFQWLVVGSCGCNAFVYSFTGYLNRLYRVEHGIAAMPQLFDVDREIFLVTRLKSCFDEGLQKIAILRGNRKGPVHKNECHLPCDT